MNSDDVFTEDGIAAPTGLAGLWAVRHGRSTANDLYADPTVDAPIPGVDAEVELSELGVEQATALGHWWAGTDRSQRPDLVFCSPYRRTRRTWEIMARTARTVDPTLGEVRARIDERLRDREMGVFELFPPAALRARAPEEGARRERVGTWVYRPPGGESLADVVLRVRGFLIDLERVAAGRRVLLVTHDAVVTALRYIAAGLGAPAPKGLDPVPNASVSQWRNEGGSLILAQWGRITHLEGGTT
ncbi:histidine phosphatase family protein [Nocardia paucivorans]|uniref:histidine phosphatase family protein n=1 Tax=Nocardia paucivorans TaxID=114259 RepID=UPI0002E99981|nr:histidine phosphatase family protein [Nocardia paucivorans]